MYQNINFSQFCDSFSEDRKNQFSYEGKKALFDYLEQLEEDTGETMELDIIALCCDYTEYDNLEDLQAEYSNIESMEDLQDHTQVIEVTDYKGTPTGGLIIQQF